MCVGVDRIAKIHTLLKCAHTHTRTDTLTYKRTPPLFDPDLALQLPETQQKASSIHCASRVFPRRARAR